MTYVYIYRMTVDSGLAPCVKNRMLSLSCCKGGRYDGVETGIRFWIGSKKDADYQKDKVYVIGILGGKLLYAAKIANVELMESYYSDTSQYKGRTDDIYNVESSRLIRNDRYKSLGIHCDEKQNNRDKNGVYVLLSTDYIYWGKDSVEFPLPKKLPKTREPAHYVGKEADDIITECWKLYDGLDHQPTSPIDICCNKPCNPEN